MLLQLIQGINKYEIEIPVTCDVNDSDATGLLRGETESASTTSGESTANSEQCGSQCAASGQWTFIDFKRKVQELTQVPVEKQRLIHRGKTLIFKDDDPIGKANFKDRDKVMVLGHRKPSEEEDTAMKSLKKIDSSIVQGIDRKINEIDSELDGIEKGFLVDQLMKDALKKLDKGLKSVGEDCMKTMELLDAMTLGESMLEHRAKRKSLVDKLHALLASHDSIEARLRQLRSKS